MPRLYINTRHRRLALFAVLLFCWCAIAAASEAGQEIAVPAWFKNSFLDIRDDIREAAAAHKQVMIYFGQNGCPYCKRLMEVNFKQQDIVDKTRRHFDAIEINIFGAREVTWIDGKTRSEKDFAALLKVQFTPTLVFLDEKGAVALRVNGYYPPPRFMAALDYLAERAGSKSSFVEFQKAHVRDSGNGTLGAEPFFRSGPYVFDRRKPAARPLAIFFEQANCSACDEMHAGVLKAELTRQLLSQFDIYRLNLQGDETVVAPDGAATTAAQWGRALNVIYAPSVVFFDRRGREIFRVEAYVRAFHLQSALDYVASNAYLKEPSFQRYVQARADTIRGHSGSLDIMK